MEALKPCPFCGNDGSGPIEDALQICHNEPDFVHGTRHTWSVQCDKCTATMGYSDTEEQAIAAWNRRAPSTDPRPAAQPGVVKGMTIDDVERIIIETEPVSMSDKGDRIWTRRMAVALAEKLAASPATSLPEDVERVVARLEEPHHMDRLDAEAAALIRTLSSQLAEARAELDALRDREDDVREEMYERGKAVGMAEHKAERGRLAAENERLRKALNQIDALDPEEHIYGCSHDATRGLVIEMGRLARAALASLEERG